MIALRVSRPSYAALGNLSSLRNPATSIHQVTIHDIIEFLDAIDSCGKSIPTKVQDHPDRPIDTAKANVSYEARLIKQMYLKLRQ